MSIGLIGGDTRYKFLKDLLAFNIGVYGNALIDTNNRKKTVDELISAYNIIIVPIPFSKDGKTLYMKYFDEGLDIDFFMEKLSNKHILLGGPFFSQVNLIAKARGIKLIDITAMESFKRKNAIPTIEGVIAKLINSTKETLFNSHILVLGYGYCGKRCVKVLSSLGANVFVYTESNVEKYNAIHEGYKIYKKDDSCIRHVINTIPVKTLSINYEENSLFIDITDAYQIENSNVIKMRGIPGRVAPLYSAQIIGETISEIIKNMVV